ncbi:hypothetical protein PRZ48_002603 [Zasmidium cellare]|uniref:Uncharacterized protein n=1 Tax=Zasmidium cellare TaxID=395010 RepID=A0ABR0ESX9_ZASCE|nr:hypothetical protein PRZ48_002603 [Zasmidium cellare]
MGRIHTLGQDGSALTFPASSAVDWNFPSPTATPTSASFNQNHFQTPKTATLPSQFFQDAFSTPQMPGYATPRQPDYPSMTPMQRAQHTSSDTLRNNFYANMQAGGPVAGQVMPPPSQAGYQAPVVSPIYGYSQALPPQPGQAMAFDTSHMQTPPPTRGTSVKKPTPGQPIAFGTPSTIASRRFLTPQQVNTTQQQQPQAMPNNPMHFPHLQFSPDVYQFSNLGPASAPVFPQTQLLWEQTASPQMYNQQQNMLDDPFAPATTGAMGWPAMPIQQNNMQPVAFDTPVMSSFPVQAPMQRPASAAPVANNQTPQPPTLSSTTTSVDPSLVYSSPMRPVLQSVPRQVKARNNASKSAASRKDSANIDHQRSETATSADAIITPVSKGGLRRSNTTGTARPSSAHPTVGGDSLTRSNSTLQPPRTASPLKRVGKASLGSISEKKTPSRASVILTIDENGRARTQTTRAEDDSPEKAMRERYPGLFDSDSSDDESEEEEQTPSRSASFSFAKGEERKSKAAKLDAPVENLEGLTLPRSSSAASMKVTPSRAAIAAAAQLRRGGSLRKQTPSKNGQRRAASNAASFIDTAPMDVPSDRRQSMVNVDDSQMDWSGSTLNEHNRRWTIECLSHTPTNGHVVSISAKPTA